MLFEPLIRLLGGSKAQQQRLQCLQQLVLLLVQH
jgi:hypothetical protein